MIAPWKVAVGGPFPVLYVHTRPNWWYRMWARVLLGFKWERNEAHPHPQAGDFITKRP